MKDLVFTGERMVPHLNKGKILYYEHLNRYYFAGQFVKGKKVLDLACGAGYGTHFLANSGAKSVVGVDIAREAIEYANTKYKHKKVEFVTTNALNLPFREDSFDIVVCFEFLEHISEQVRLLEEIRRVTRKDGLLIISTPNTKLYIAKNKFHRKELTFNKMNKLLKKLYKNVIIGGQYFWLANSIVFYGKKNSTKNRDKVKFNESNIQKAQYFVAVCSDMFLPNFNQALLVTEKADTIDLSLGAEAFDSKFSAQNQKIVALTAELDEIKNTFWYKLAKSIKKILKFSQR